MVKYYVDMTTEEKQKLMEKEANMPRDNKYSQYGGYKTAPKTSCSIIDWLLVSNRWKHLLGGFVLGLFLTVLCALGCAGGMEYKDVAYHKNDWHFFDWVDFALTVAGGVVGQAVQLAIVWLFIHNF